VLENLSPGVLSHYHACRSDLNIRRIVFNIAMNVYKGRRLFYLYQLYLLSSFQLFRMYIFTILAGDVLNLWVLVTIYLQRESEKYILM
jgi:hypothetical protein